MTTRFDRPLVSIITPAYNGEEYLRECIESVLAQTYENWEYIILNNASTDRTLAIAQEYAARDPRVRVHSNSELLPMVKNHNAALALMSPEAAFCKPLMADDWLLPDCIEKLVAAASRSPSIGLVCGMAFDGRHVYWDGWPYPADCVPGRDVARAHLLDANFYIFGSPTSTLVRADLVRRPGGFYNEENLAPDYEACLDVLRTSDFAFVHQILMFHRVHEASVTSAMYDMEGGLAGRLYTLVKCGRDFLAPDEYARRRAWALRKYYQVLAYHALQFPGGAFWGFHKRILLRMGAPLNGAKLVGAIGRKLLELVLHPVELVESLGAYCRRMRTRLQSR